MRVALLSDTETEGGAAIAASRLAAALVARGHEVWRLAAWPDAGQHPWRTRSLAPAPPLLWVPGQTVRHVLLRSMARRALRAALDEVRPDVINVHNLHGAWGAGWSIRHVVDCVERAPTVWTLHDMWSFTGRCAYAGDCRRFVEGCDAACPTWPEYPRLRPRHIAWAWRERRRALASSTSLVGVTPSRWLAAEAARGLWRGHRVDVIPNGVPLDSLRPQERAAARRALNVPEDAPVLLAVAAKFEDTRKGVRLLLEALRRLGRPLTLLFMGPDAPTEVPAHVRALRLGHLGSAKQQSLAYSAADLNVHPSIADNLPNTIVEALACGTPTVGFRVGGVVDLVRPGVTGWLAEQVSEAALARSIDEALAALGTEDLRRTCRAVAEAEYSDDLQAARYISLFDALRGRTASG